VAELLPVKAQVAGVAPAHPHRDQHRQHCQQQRSRNIERRRDQQIDRRVAGDGERHDEREGESEPAPGACLHCDHGLS
jgi:hypothetical protein